MVARVAAIFGALVASLVIAQAAMTVVPMPLAFKVKGDTLSPVAPDFRFIPTGVDSEILENAFNRYYSIIFRRVMSGNERARPRPQGVPANGVITTCEVNVSSADQTLDLKTDESYSLDTTTGATIKLSAVTVFGALRGLETLAQLMERGGTALGAYQVDDKPRFQYRGSMIDTARHFYPVNVIYQHLDAMAYAKLNVLHWHIVDDQSFPYMSRTFPELSRAGAFSPSHVYSVEDIQKVQTYARDRGIRVIPEFDTPGHVTRGLNALNPPVLTDCYDASGKVKGTGPLNPTINATYDFMTKFMAEVKQVFWDQYVHIGGDEVIMSCWMSNPQIQAWMKQHPEVQTGADLQQHYILKLLDILRAQKSSYIVWQEVFDDGAKLLPDTVVEVWKEENWQDDMAAVTKANLHSVLAAPFYLNYIKYGLDWKAYYTVEPSNFTGGAQAESSGLLSGLEACMWSEYVDASNFIARMWARGAAVAERAWSAKTVTDVEDAMVRLSDFRCKLLDRGINAEPMDAGARIYVNGGRNFCQNEWNPRYSPPWI